MKTWLLVILIACLSQASGVRAEVRTIWTMRDILPTVKSTGTLLVLDLDNTVIEPAQNLGSDQWFYYLLERFKKTRGFSEKEALAKAEAVWNHVQWLIEVKAVEPEIPKLIAELQDRGIRTLGLTARSPEIAARTVRQLERIGVRFDRRSVGGKSYRERGILFEGGILFVGEGRDKGEALVDHLKRTNVRPARIMFVDDKLYNVRDMERALRRHGLPADLFCYRATEEKVRAFNADMADPELFFDGVIGEQASTSIRRARRGSP